MHGRELSRLRLRAQRTIWEKEQMESGARVVAPINRYEGPVEPGVSGAGHVHYIEGRILHDL